MDNHPTSPPLRDPFAERPSVRDLYELLRLPALFAVGTAVITWLIWYYTSISCTAELAALIGCNPATIARYINVDIFGRMLTYSAITGAAGGVWNYDMFTKMRAAMAAERSRADEAVQQLAEYRQQAEAQLAEFRQQAEEERRQEREAFMTAFAEERRRSDEERQQMQQQANEDRQQMQQRANEDRQQMQQRANEDRQQMQQEANEERRRSDEERRLLQQQASENQQAFVAALTEITAQMAHLAQQRNGSNGDAPNGD